jgi:hypothetical protein
MREYCDPLVSKSLNFPEVPTDRLLSSVRLPSFVVFVCVCFGFCFSKFMTFTADHSDMIQLSLKSRPDFEMLQSEKLLNLTEQARKFIESSKRLQSIDRVDTSLPRGSYYVTVQDIVETVRELQLRNSDTMEVGDLQLNGLTEVLFPDEGVHVFLIDQKKKSHWLPKSPWKPHK